MKTFENKTVVITGGTSGIGKATAVAFSQHGANVVVSGRRILKAKMLSARLPLPAERPSSSKQMSVGRRTSSP
jgi:NAD(P)-dependent dehydrogenase (short-subunit alcohol dehydrogenase family)